MNAIFFVCAQILGTPDELGIPVVNADDGTLQTILGIVFSITGALSAIFIIIGGLRYVISAGDSTKVEQAKKTIIYAVVGLLVSIFAFAIVSFVLTTLGDV